MHTELLTASDYIVALEARCYQANKTSLEVLNNLRSAEARYEHDVASLKSYIIDLKSRLACYIPVKSDPTDVALAEYINSGVAVSQKMQIMFMRESVGVYEFGTRRIMLKASNLADSKLLVKTGAANWIGIDEFLEQAMPVELIKLERREPLKQVTSNVAALCSPPQTTVNENSTNTTI